MNSFKASITKIEKVDSLNYIELNYRGKALSMVSLELDSDLKVGVSVEIVFNPSHVSIGKNLRGDLSCSNRLNGIIENIDNGKILSSLQIRVEESELIESIITRTSSDRVNLKVGERIEALIKATEISISEIVNG